jgi:hypothetical protein
VDQICQQRDAARRDKHHCLRQRGDGEHHEGQRDGTNAVARARDGRIDEAVRMPVSVTAGVVAAVTLLAALAPRPHAYAPSPQDRRVPVLVGGGVIVRQRCVVPVLMRMLHASMRVRVGVGERVDRCTLAAARLPPAVARRGASRMS